jgi:hypothetical protein
MLTRPAGSITSNQLFTLRQILEKCNEFYITTHHLYIDFKAAYDTIIRNEVGMSELNFPTKLIRLTKATLTIVTCCVKIQNDCSKSFKIRDGLRQGDVLSTLMTPTNDVSLEIQQIIQTANRCLFGLRKHLQSSHLSRQTKFTIHKTLICPVLLYGSETWVFIKKEEYQLLVFERKVLRTICSPKIENSFYRRRYNHEFDKKFDSPNALNVKRTSNQMIRRAEDPPQKSLFRAKLNERRNQKRLKSGWVDRVNSDSLALWVRD